MDFMRGCKVSCTVHACLHLWCIMEGDVSTLHKTIGTFLSNTSHNLLFYYLFARLVCSQVDDVEGIKAQGINPLKVASLLVEVFAEMVFCHGHLHGDPHPGNVLIRKADLKHPSGRDFELGESDGGVPLPACQL